MIEIYSKYSGLSIDEIKNNPQLQYLNPGFYSDRNIMIGKYQLMSPHMLGLVLVSHYRTCIEYAGGVGLLAEVIKESSPLMNVTYANIDCDEFRFAKWRINDLKKDVRLLELSSYHINDTYDVIISDGVVQNFEKDIQIEMVSNMMEKVNKNGILCLLIDLSKDNVNIVDIHQILEQSNMVCIYGKNTYSSVWKKII